MTNLYLSILETADKNEISAETRDKLFEVLTEASPLVSHTQVFKNYEKEYPEFKNLLEETKKCEKELKSINKYDRPAYMKLTKLVLKLTRLMVNLTSIKLAASTIASIGGNKDITSTIKSIVYNLLKLSVHKLILVINNMAITLSDISIAQQCIKNLDDVISKETDPDQKEKLINMRNSLSDNVDSAKDLLNSVDVGTGTLLARRAAKKALKETFAKESTEMKVRIYEECVCGHITEAERDKLLKLVDERSI